MRSLVPTVFAAALFVLPAPAESQLLTLGVKGGATFATVAASDGTGLGDVGQRDGTVFGASVALGGGIFGFRPEFLLVEKGFGGEDAADDRLLDVDYIEIPMLLMLRLGVGGIRPAVFAGPTVAIERACTISGGFDGIDLDGDCDAPSIDLERETTDWGAAFGAELAIDVGPIAVAAEGRYTLGLTNLVVDEEEDEEAFNRVFSFMAGIQIPIG